MSRPSVADPTGTGIAANSAEVRPMHFDPTTVCVRTFAGEAEARRPSQGLSIAQRRVLVLLDRPRGLAHFAALHHIPPVRLERDLVHLAGLGLVALLSAGEAQALAVAGQAAD